MITALAYVWVAGALATLTVMAWPRGGRPLVVTPRRLVLAFAGCVGWPVFWVIVWAGDL